MAAPVGTTPPTQIPAIQADQLDPYQIDKTSPAFLEALAQKIAEMDALVRAKFDLYSAMHAKRILFIDSSLKVSNPIPEGERKRTEEQLFLDKLRQKLAPLMNKSPSFATTEQDKLISPPLPLLRTAKDSKNYADPKIMQTCGNVIMMEQILVRFLNSSREERYDASITEPRGKDGIVPIARSPETESFIYNFPPRRDYVYEANRNLECDDDIYDIKP